jgi:diguanylate cyclase (GGDEF)-like protein
MCSMKPFHGLQGRFNHDLMTGLNEIVNHKVIDHIDHIDDKLMTVLDHMGQGLVMYDGTEAMNILLFNRRFCELFGIPENHIHIGMSYRDMIQKSQNAGNHVGYTLDQAVQRCQNIAQGRAEPLQSWYKLCTGRYVEVLSVEVKQEYIVTYTDVSERYMDAEKINYLAHYDSLTGLANRMLFREHLERSIASLDRGNMFAVMYLDLDGFKAINDVNGHPIGDQLLQEVSNRIKACVRESDIVARLGGDEFAIIQSAIADASSVIILAERIVKVIAAITEVNGIAVTTSVSIGIALAPHDGSDADMLLNRADMALYQSKHAGKSTHCFFNSVMDLKVRERRKMEADLRHAVAKEQFVVHYQPLIDPSSGAVRSMEALVRWIHEERGIIPPDAFISIAEECGLICRIGEWVMREACIQATQWPDHVGVCVNVSPIQMNDSLVDLVSQSLQISGLDPSRLEIEITESAMLNDTEQTLDILRRIKNMGVCVVMDDFGTGYSSFRYLISFPFDKIKIDRSFVNKLSGQATEEEISATRTIINAMIGLAHNLQMRVTVEGIENQKQMDILLVNGCDEMQGYLFSKPVASQHALTTIQRIEQKDLQLLPHERESLVL